jgi:ornithine--oxo-acid transaminase
MDSTLSASRQLITLEERFGARNYHPLDVVITRGKGIWVWDVDGNRYLDCLAAYSAVNQGHCHPRIVTVLEQQAKRITLTSRAFRNDQLGPFYEELSAITGYPRVLPMNTGAEAVETAIKMARKWAYTIKGVAENDAEILVFSDNFHGRTTTLVGFSTDEQYKQDFGPFTPGFRCLPYGDIDAVHRALNPNVAAVLIEPIQGEAGIIIPPDGYLRDLEAACHEHGALFIVDEIQSGLGRTGRLFAFEHEGVRPDAVIVGKALGGGCYPVSAVLAADEPMSVFDPGDHGSTFGGNPLGCAVAREALRVLVEEHMVENSAELGNYFLERLRGIDSHSILEVRGRGLWVGLELYAEAGGARRYCEGLRAEGVLCKETHEHVIRFAPPLVIERDEVDWAVDRVRRVFETLG